MLKIKTLIELFDECQLENIISCLSFLPQKIVFVGFKNVMTNKKKRDLENFFVLKGINVRIEYEIVGRYELRPIIDKLIEIIDKNDDCCLDLTGGKELVLAAMGVVATMRSIPIIQFDIRTGRFVKVKNCDGLSEPQNVCVSIDECTVLGGGVVINDKAEWNLTLEFKSDLDKIWQLCKSDCAMWNRVSGALASFDKSEDINNLFIRVNLDTLNPLQLELLEKSQIFSKLRNNGLILDYSQKGNLISFKYKSLQVKRCISKAGNALELYAYMLMQEINEEEDAYYNDVKIGVRVDWDGILHDGIDNVIETRNEIDVFVMRGVIPCFVSCKNGEVHKEALYELFTVADKFGGEYAKKILLTTNLSLNSISRKTILQRASEMKIVVLDGVHKMSRDEFKSFLKTKIR